MGTPEDVGLGETNLWLVPAEPTRVFLIDKSLVGQPTYGAGVGPVVAEGTPHRHQVGMISMQLVPETPKRALAPKRAAQALARHPMTDPLGEVDHVLIPDGRRQRVNEDQVVQLIDVDRVVAIDATVTGPEHDLPTLWVDQPPMVVVSLVGQRRGDFFDIDGIQVEHVVSVGRAGSFAQGVRCGKGGRSNSEYLVRYSGLEDVTQNTRECSPDRVHYGCTLINRALSASWIKTVAGWCESEETNVQGDSHVTSIPVPPHGRAVEEWRQSIKSGTREDRMLREVTVWLPPRIAELNIAVSSPIVAETEEALREIASLDETHGEHLASLSTLLLRAESVASSKIEQVEASMDDYARALHGIKSNVSALSMVASTRALDDLIRSVQAGEEIALERVYRAHGILMADDPYERPHAGRVRDMQNWIEGSDHSPRNASYVPPPPRMVNSYMDDLMRFANRRDVGALLQSAIAHAQFESIHPFTDGNGRIGRALINTILRRRGTTRRVVVPLASAIVAGRGAYFAALNAYRKGDAGPIVESFARGSLIAAQESRVTAERLAQMPQEWREATGRPRRGSAAAKMLDVLVDYPIFSADEVEQRVGGATSSVYAAITRLHEAGVIRPLTNRTRNQIWVASALAEELDDLGVRIAARYRNPPPQVPSQ